MDDLLQQAIERREQLRAELEAIERFIVQLQQVKERQAPASSKSQFTLWREASRPRLAHVAAVRAMIDRAEEIIVAEARPLTRSQLVTRLEAEGHKIIGSDKNKVLGTNLWRSGRFWNLKGAGYWPKDHAIPAEFAALPKQ